MATADEPVNLATAAPHNFKDDKHLDEDDEENFDHDDDEGNFDHDDDDSASSIAVARVDRQPPPTSTAQVTIAVPGVADPQLILQQRPENVAINKRVVPPDESRKLFQRLWTDEDEIELLQGFLDYTTHGCGPHSSSQHHHDTTAFYDQIKSKFQLDFNKNQLVEKLRRLKKKYRNVVNKFGSGKDCTFKSPHDQATFQISSKIWGTTAVNVNVYPALPATATAPIEEDDDDLNNSNFTDCQSPKLKGIDINSKLPRPRKRSRSGLVKVEDRQQHAPHSSNINTIQPSAVTQVAPTMCLGITKSMSGVIEETVKSCLSPILKELLSSLMINSHHYPHGPYSAHGLELARSPLTLFFDAAVGGEGDKLSNNRWRKQQILELEVFSKRLELVQDQIREQLEELRSVGN